jgi:hypothetical protein
MNLAFYEVVTLESTKIVYKWFQNLQSGSKSRRAEGFKRRNIFNISSIKSLGPTQELGLRGGFETTCKRINIYVTPCSSIPVFHNDYDTNVSHNTKLESFFKWIGGYKFNIGPLLGIDLYFKNKMA